MTILLLERDAGALDRLSKLVAALRPEAELLAFTDSPTALAAARKKEIDAAFLSISTATGLRDVSGVISARI